VLDAAREQGHDLHVVVEHAARLGTLVADDLAAAPDDVVLDDGQDVLEPPAGGVILGDEKPGPRPPTTPG
jgi:hypothetical protein